MPPLQSPGRRLASLGLSLVLAPSLASLSLPARAAPTYHLVDLGPSTQADHIDNRGDISGRTANDVGYLRHGTWHSTADVGTIAAADDRGDLLEASWGGQVVYAPRGGSAITLPPVPGVDWSVGTGIAPGRVIVQAAVGPYYIAACYLWTPDAGYQAFGAPGAPCVANAVNESGQVTGWHVDDIGATVAYVWTDGVFQDIPVLPGAVRGAMEIEEGTGINRHGHVVLFARMKDGSYHAGLFRGRHVVDIGACAAGAPLAISDSDQVIGSTDAGDGWLWSAGVSTPLSQLVDAGPEWTSLQGSSINADGVIVGNGLLSGEPHAFVLRPVGAQGR